MGKNFLNAEWLKLTNFLPFQNPNALKWLYSPPKEAIYFSLRTIIASFLALAIALWMQLDSPKWAMMTVWIVAQTSPGETIAKSQWRVVGTIIGVIMAVAMIALFPQEPMLFGIAMALWMGGCCWLGSLIRGSSSYSFVLAGYTCALIGFASVNNPNDVFMTAMARGSYIILGVLCQSFIERLFAFNMDQKAKKSLHDNLLKAITGSLTIIVDVLKGDYKAAFRVQNVFTAVSAFQNSIEFRKIEMLHDDHMADHVHATLSSVSIVLARLINLTVYMQNFITDKPFNDVTFKVTKYLEVLIGSLNKQTDFTEHLNELSKLRWECRQVIADYIYYDAIDKSEEGQETSDGLLDRRILYRSLSKLLGEIEAILVEYQFALNPKKTDKFKFSLPPIYNFKMAWWNGFRVFIAVLVACFLWEITAWNEFPGSIGLLCVACGRLCLFENGYKMCIGFLKGTIWGVLVSGILDVSLMAQAGNIDMVYLALFIPLFIGGLAIYNIPTRGVGMSFTIFFPFMIILGNQVRMDEETFLNSMLVMLIGVGMAVFAFRFIAPYAPKKVRREIRIKMLHSVRSLANISPLPNSRRWLVMTMEWFVSLMRQFDASKETMLVQKYNHGALAVMSIGLNIMEIRKMIDQDILPEDIKNELRVVMRRVSHFRGGRRYGRTVLIAKSAIRRLRLREKAEENLAKRLEISMAIACLTLIYFSLEKNVAFLNPSYRLYSQD